MDNFSIFDQALEQYTAEKAYDTIITTKIEQCAHKNIRIESNITTCEDCGKEITRELDFEKEWRYYGASDTKHNSDPNRCNARKSTIKTIHKDVENLGFSDKIITEANSIYEQTTNGKIYRGKSRKSIIFACIFHAYKMAQNPQSCEHLIDIFSLEKKVALKGLKYVNLNAPKESTIRTTYITPENLINEIMKKFDAPQEQIDEVVSIYGRVKNKSSIMNRSRPQSVASGLVRYYILLRKKDISMNEFRVKVDLSELTIIRIVKEIARILETPEITE